MTSVVNEYLRELKFYLTGMDKKEKENVINFYQEILLDSQVKSRPDLINQFGEPKQLARKILANYSINGNYEVDTDVNNGKEKSTKLSTDLQSIKWIILGLASVPLGVPLLIIIFTFMLVLGIFLAVIIGVVLAFFSAALLIMYKAFPLIFGNNWAVGCFYFGSSLAFVILILILVPLIFSVIRFLISLMTKFSKKIGRHVFTENFYKVKDR